MKLIKHLSQYLLEILEEYEKDKIDIKIINDIPKLIQIIELMMDTCPNPVFEKISRIILEKENNK